MKNLLEPPIDTGFGNLPTNNKRQTVRGDSDNLSANSFAEIASTLSRFVVFFLFIF
jgi:hypothetical protein